MSERDLIVITLFSFLDVLTKTTDKVCTSLTLCDVEARFQEKTTWAEIRALTYDAIEPRFATLHFVFF